MCICVCAFIFKMATYEQMKLGISLSREYSSINKVFLFASYLQTLSLSWLQFSIAIFTSKQTNALLHICCQVLCLPIMLFWRDCKTIISKNLILEHIFKSTCSFFLNVLFWRGRFLNIFTFFFFLIWVTVSWVFLNLTNFFESKNYWKVFTLGLLALLK